jgi:hypothetical protein
MALKATNPTAGFASSKNSPFESGRDGSDWRRRLDKLAAPFQSDRAAQPLLGSEFALCMLLDLQEYNVALGLSERAHSGHLFPRQTGREGADLLRCPID